MERIDRGARSCQHQEQQSEVISKGEGRRWDVGLRGYRFHRIGH